MPVTNPTPIIPVKPPAVVLKTFDQMDYNPIVKKMADILCAKTQTSDPLFFRIMVSYYLTKVASMMRCNIQTLDRGTIPVSMYAVNLAISGHGKGHSTNIMEEDVIGKFRGTFLNQTFEAIATPALEMITLQRTTKYGSEYDVEHANTLKEFDDLGPLLFSFDSGTTPAVKQARHKLLMSGAGSINMEVDEIGSNLLGQQDILTTFLELFDVGKVKPKLIKNTSDSKRNEEIIGRTPTNMMLFGTPEKLLDGGKTEDEFESILSTGYARRCIFGYTPGTSKTNLTASEVFVLLTDSSLDNYIQKLSHKLDKLANTVNFNTTLTMSPKVAMIVLEYRIQCEKEAALMGSYQHILKAELSHRYFKMLKLAGTYAFIDSSPEITEDHIYQAMKLVMDSGICFERIMDRDTSSIRLAKYISEVRREVTHADIIEDLPFFKGTEGHRREMVKLATQWGYKNNIVIKMFEEDGIEFLKGESLKKINLEEITISYSTDIAQGYKNELVPFEDLEKLFLAQNYHWVNHHLKEGHRREENCIPGFDIVTIDVDSGTPIATTKLLMKEFKYLLYTTKRHTKSANRYRMVFPLSHHLNMDAKDFKEFMNNIYDWLPFEVDKQTNQRARKWLCNDKASFINHDGELLDVLPFIPKTKKADERKVILSDQRSLSNLERWFIQKTDSGNRSNQMIKYALMLVDAGMDIETIKDKVLGLNSKLPTKLPEAEILATILVTVSKKIHQRDTQ